MQSVHAVGLLLASWRFGGSGCHLHVLTYHARRHTGHQRYAGLCSSRAWHCRILRLLLHARLLPGLSHGGAKLLRRQCRQKGSGLLLLLLLHALRPPPWQLLLDWGRLQELLLSYKRRLLKMLLLLAVWLRPHACPQLLLHWLLLHYLRPLLHRPLLHGLLTEGLLLLLDMLLELLLRLWCLQHARGRHPCRRWRRHAPGCPSCSWHYCCGSGVQAAGAPLLFCESLLSCY